MVAIVTDVHYRMSLALIRDLSQAGVEVITCEKTYHRHNPAAPALGALSRFCGEHHWLEEERYADELHKLCRQVGEKRNCRPALLPVGAATLALLSRERARFDEVCGLVIPTSEQLDLFNSKARLGALAAQLSVPVPESFCRGEKTAEEFTANLPLPCVVKPVCGEKLGLTAAHRYAIVKTPTEALERFNHFRSLAGEDPLVQTWLPGGGMGCSVLAVNGTVLAAICHRRLREYPVSGGPSSCCACVQRPNLEEYASRLVEKTGYTGLAMFEFKEDAAGNPRLLEVNPRIWGTFPLTRVAESGIPLLWCILAWNAANPDAALPLPAKKAPLPRKMIFCASDLMAAVGYAKRGRIGTALCVALDLINPAVRDGLFQWTDIRPGLAYFRSLLTKEKH